MTLSDVYPISLFMKKEKGLYQVSLKVIMKNTKGEILGLKAIDKGSMRGYFDLPGGRIDSDEFYAPFDEIIKREIREEVGDVNYTLNNSPVALGRHLIPSQISSSGKDIKVVYIFFEAKYLKGEIAINDEHLGFEWIDISKIKLEDYFDSGILEGMRMYLKHGN